MITIKEQPTEPVQPAWILRRDVKQIALETFADFTKLQASWIDQSGKTDDETKTFATVSAAEICGAHMFMQMLFNELEVVCE